jgi:hypothetical protein
MNTSREAPFVVKEARRNELPDPQGRWADALTEWDVIVPVPRDAIWAHWPDPTASTKIYRLPVVGQPGYKAAVEAFARARCEYVRSAVQKLFTFQRRWPNKFLSKETRTNAHFDLPVQRGYLARLPESLQRLAEHEGGIDTIRLLHLHLDDLEEFSAVHTRLLALETLIAAERAKPEQSRIVAPAALDELQPVLDDLATMAAKLLEPVRVGREFCKLRLQSVHLEGKRPVLLAEDRQEELLQGFLSDMRHNVSVVEALLTTSGPVFKSNITALTPSARAIGE